MQSSLAILMLAAFIGCRTGDPVSEPHQPDSAPIPATDEVWAAASTAGPVLIGVVTHPAGHALAGIQVKAHGGFATRFPLLTTHTDDLGRYRFDPVEGSFITGVDGTPMVHVGVCVGSVSGVNPPEYLPWVDVQVMNAPGTVERLDFKFDPESVPLEVR